MSLNGATVLLSVRTASGPDVYTTIGSQTGLSVSDSNEEIDYSSKDSRNFTGAAGRYKSTISCDMLYVPSSTSLAALKTAVRAGTAVRVRVSAMGADPVEQADGFITSYDREMPDQGPCTVSLQVTVTGAWGPAA